MAWGKMHIFIENLEILFMECFRFCSTLTERTLALSIVASETFLRLDLGVDMIQESVSQT